MSNSIHTEGAPRFNNLTLDHVRRHITAMLETAPDGVTDDNVIRAALAQILGHYAYGHSNAEVVRYLGGTSRFLRRGGCLTM